jgi:hypothetical protein
MSTGEPLTVALPRDVEAALVDAVRTVLRAAPELRDDATCLMDEVRQHLSFGSAARIVTAAVSAAIAQVLKEGVTDIYFAPGATEACPGRLTSRFGARV